MKISSILIFVFTLSAFASGKAQNISADFKESSLKDVFAEIKKQTGFHFLYNERLISKTGKVSFSIKDEKVENVLVKALAGQNLTYTKRGNNITIAADLKQKSKGVPYSYENKSIQRTVQGRVVSHDNEPLAGVSVLEKGTQKGTTTNENGQFSVAINNDNTILVFSSIGFVTQEFSVKNLPATITLLEDLAALEEVVVVGYGTQKKVNLTGSVAVIDGKELENRPVVNATQSLQGVVPGLNVNVAGNTKPGQSFNLNVRGVGNLSNTDNPYVLVDGMEMSLSDVNPSDIESISVLKDASASAIYGSRAAYGVILVTTKKGSASKRTIAFSSNTGITSAVRLPDMANSVEFANYFNSATFNALGVRQYSEDKIALLEQYIKDPTGMSIFPEVNSNNYANWENSANGVANTNWFDLHYKPYALRQNYNVSLSGGNEVSQFYVSGGYYNEGGTLRYADINYKRYNFNANITSQLASWVKLKANTKYTHSNNESPLAGFEGMFFHNLARMRPNVSAYDLNGNWTEQSMIPYLQSGSKSDVNTSTLALLTGVEIEPVENWRIFVDLNMRQLNVEGSNLKLPGTIYGINGTPILVNRSEYNIPLTGSYARNMDNHFYISPNIYTNYTRTVAEKHNFDITLGYQQEANNYKNLSASVSDLISFDRPGINLGTGDKLADEERNHWATRGFFGRFNYNYNQKFLFEVNGRYDGSSRFSSKERWGFFPSFSAGYNISEEAFIKDKVSWLQQLKIRGSYGFLGNQAGAGMYSYSENMNVVVPGLNTGGRWYYNNGRESYIEAPGAFNPFITWENVENTNLGLDFALLNYHLSGSFDIYQRNTRDMLGPSKDVADMYGATPPSSNNADLRTRGWELSLKWRSKIGDDITYSVGALVSDYQSVVTKYQNPTRFNPANAWYEGKTAGEIWGYKASGIIQNEAEALEYNKLDKSFLSARDWVPGDVRYLDISGDGKINQGGNIVGDMGDLSIIGNSNPRYSYAINTNVTWKGIGLSMLWQGVGKKDFAPAALDAYFWGSGALAQVTVFKEHLDYWTPENPNAYYPNPYASPVGAIASYTNKTQLISDRYLQNAAYLRLKNLTVNYSLPNTLTQKWGLNKINVFVSGENLLTVTKLAKMFDPETLVGGQAPGKVYPLSKVYSLGVNVNF